MAYTKAQKKAMYDEAHTDLTKAALALKTFSEDADLFVDQNPTGEQQQAGRDYHLLADLIGRFTVESKANEASK